MAAETLTDYEIRRLENIRRNADMISSLRLRTTASALSSAFKPRPKILKKSPKIATPSPVRRSLRLRGIPTDPSDLPQPPADAPALESEELHIAVPKQLHMADAFTSGPDSADKPLIDTILKSSEGKRNNLGDKIGKEGKGFDPTRDLVLREDNVRKVLRVRILAIRFLPLVDRDVIVGGDKFGNVGFWDVNCDDGDRGVYVYTPHSLPVSGISAHSHSPGKIFTCSYDGCIRAMDVKGGTFNAVYSCDYAIYSICQLPDNDSSLYFAEGSGELKHWDARKGETVNTWDLHEQRINSIDFHPLNTNLVATSSSDGLACIWDLRYAKKTRAQSLKTVQHKKSVQSAYFSPTGSYLATTSFDDTVGIIDGVKFDDISVVSHYNQTGRWISSFRAIWGWDDSNLFIGNMRRAVDVISVPVGTTLSLQSENLTSIPCRFAAHPYKTGFLAGSSAGKIYLWTRS